MRAVLSAAALLACAALPLSAQATGGDCSRARPLGTTANGRPGSANEIRARWTVTSVLNGAAYLSVAYVYEANDQRYYAQFGDELIPIPDKSKGSVLHAYSLSYLHTSGDKGQIWESILGGRASYALQACLERRS